MFDIFGEFDSAEKINKAAEGLKNEGDFNNLLLLVKENGIDEEIAKAFIDGEIPYIADAMSAAIGKIEVEKEAIKDSFFSDMKEDMINYLQSACMDESFARAIRKKGKSLKDCFEHTKKEITKKLGSKNGGLRDRDVYAMQKEYYTKG